MEADGPPLCHLPEAAQIGWLTLADGARIRTLILPHDQPRARLLVVTGRADFLEKWADAFARLHGLGFALAAFDWRGQGLSTCPVPETGDPVISGPEVSGHVDSFDPWVDDLDHITGWALTELGTGPWLALGHSMGGHLLARWLFDPERTALPLHQLLRGAILASPLFGLGLPWPLPLVARFASGCAVRFGRGRHHAWGEGPPTPERLAAPSRQQALTGDLRLFADEIGWISANPALATSGASWGWLNAFFRSQALLERQPLNHVTRPLLLLLGGRDHVVSNGAALRLTARLPACRQEILAGAAHELLREVPEIRARALSLIDAFALETLA